MSGLAIPAHSQRLSRLAVAALALLAAGSFTTGLTRQLGAAGPSPFPTPQGAAGPAGVAANIPEATPAPALQVAEAEPPPRHKAPAAAPPDVTAALPDAPPAETAAADPASPAAADASATVPEPAEPAADLAAPPT